MSGFAHSLQMDNICRTCLSEEQSMKSLFDTDSSLGLQLFEMLMACTSVQVQEDDDLPAQICLSCINHIARSFTFKKICEDSDYTLREMLRKSTILFDVEPVIERKPPSDVLWYYKEEVADEFEEGKTNIGDLIPSNDYSDAPTIESANDQDTKPIIKENLMPDESSVQPIYACAECIATFTVKHDLEIHSRTHRERDGEANASATTHKCEVCGKVFAYPSQLHGHMKVHIDERPHLCNVCGRAFKRANELKRHLTTHTGDNSFVCKVCGMGLDSWTSLRAHKKIHVGAKDHVCTDCGKRFSTARTLRVHRALHTGERPYICNVCNKGFVQRSRLTSHARAHNGERPYVCDVCQKGFRMLCHLKEHMGVHTDEKSYQCHRCGKTFQRKHNMRTHILRNMGERGDHICVYCKKGFHRANQLTVHLRTHTVKTLYTCDICHKSYARKQYLMYHLRSHRTAA